MSQHEQEEEGEEGASPKDTAEEKLPGSDSEDSDDDDSLVLYCLPSTIHTQFKVSANRTVFRFGSRHL